MTEKFEVGFQFFLNMAHYGAHTDPAHANRRLHGHSYEIHLLIAGDPDPETGYAVDAEKVQSAIAQIQKEADHRLMNEIPGMGHSMETLAKWIGTRLIEAEAGRVTCVEIRRPSLGMLCRYSPA